MGLSGLNTIPMEVRRMRKLIAGAALALLFASGSAAAQKWNLPAGYPTSNPHTENLMLFADDVRKATGGKLDITVHANASLFKVPEIKKAVQTGQAQAGGILMLVLQNDDPAFGGDVVPFLPPNWGDALKLCENTKTR